MSSFQERKRALVAEAEIYRQTLKLEIQNLRICSAHVQRQIRFFSASNPLLLLLPLLLSWERSRRQTQPIPKTKRRWSRALGGMLTGWRLYQQFAPLVRRSLPLLLQRRRASGARSEGNSPAARI